jgi:putative ABC transport system permease protein
MNMLELRDIKKEYIVAKKPLEVLKGINLQLNQKEFVAILGPSGCGKTTLLNLIGGLDQYTSGDLIIEGKSTKQFKDADWDAYRNHRVGFVFQNYNLIMHLNVLQNVELSLSLSGIPVQARKKRAIEVLESVGLGDKIYKRPNQLSGGEMQRVAIARSMVNDPDILLADEPTGALDSSTSIPVLDLLKEISYKKLVIMVTHNQELAKKYATRIIRLSDGEIISDSANLSQEDKTQVIGREENEKTSMNFITALKISFNNLLTKKGRTILTSFAGSIGIVGVALVLAVSNGFTQYINKLESDTLSGFPITISDVAYNNENLQQDTSSPYLPEEETINVYTPEFFMLHTNKWTNEYVEYIKALEDTEWINSVLLRYSIGMNLVVEDPNGNVYLWEDDGLRNPFAQLSNMSNSSFQELVGNEDYILTHYDLLGSNSVYPQAANEIVLVVDQYNRVNRSILQNLGIIGKNDNTTTTFAFDDVIGREVKVYSNDEFYIEDETARFTVVDLYQGTPNNKEMRFYKKPNSSQLLTLYEDEEKGSELTITGVLRLKESAPIRLMPPGLAYTSELTSILLDANKNSQVAAQQLQNWHIITNTPIPTPVFYSVLDDGDESSIDEFIADSKILGAELIGHPIDQYLNTFSAFLGFDLSFNLSLVSGASIYPKSFDDKANITNYLDQWNVEREEVNHIYYNDLAANLTETLGIMIDVISIVLVVFASIALVVSSVMIGIITYVSVIERTKEIGVLRAIGARKKDIGRLFEAETVIIGFIAGVFGIAITLLLTIPVNLILNFYFPGQGLETIASLNPWHAFVLIFVSIILTLTSGLIPSKIAAKKDPVVALRTE